MIKTIKRLVFAYKYKRAAKKAVRIAREYNCKMYVIYINGGLKVVPKQRIKELVKAKRFKKGTTVEDIERHALFVTN